MRAKRVDLLSLVRGLIPIGSMFGNYRLSKMVMQNSNTRPPHSLSKDVRISVLKSANKGVISTKVRMSANLRKRGLFS